MVASASSTYLCAFAFGLSALLTSPAARAQNPDPGDPSVEPDPAPKDIAPAAPTLAAVNAPEPDLSDTPPPLTWNWSRFSSADYVFGATAGAVTLATAIINPRKKHVRGGLWFDNAVRNALRVRSLPNRYIFRDASDVGLSLAVSWPFVADALTAAWWYRGSRDVAEQMALIDLETLAVSGAIQGVTNTLVSRERPYGRNCGSSELPNEAIDCEGSAHYRSFFSGHATLSFTGAALICVHHFENDLLGAPWDAVSCAGGYAVAATTATFRVVSDVHYASDVLAGALVGTLVGYGVPLLHYRNKNSAHETSGLELHVVPSPGGIGLLGIF